MVWFCEATLSGVAFFVFVSSCLGVIYPHSRGAWRVWVGVVALGWPGARHRKVGRTLGGFPFSPPYFLRSCFLAYHSRAAWHTGREFGSGRLRRTGPVPGTGRWVGLGRSPFSFVLSFAPFLSPVSLLPGPSFHASTRSLADGAAGALVGADDEDEECRAGEGGGGENNRRQPGHGGG